MKVLHLSDTTLSGSPIRIVDVLNKYSQHQARHIVWHPVVHQWRKFKLDMVGSTMPKDELLSWLDWADVIHLHNRWQRQEIFKHLGVKPPKKPSVVQVHSPRDSEDFGEEVASGLPLAIVSQYHVRQWPEARYIVPNCVDLNAPEYQRETPPLRTMPVVSFAPSNWNGRGFESKGYEIVAPIMKRMGLAREIYSQIITSLPHDEVMKLKRGADIGIDEIVTGSFHISSLEYLALGVPCFANIDSQTDQVIRKLTGADTIPWLIANKENFKSRLQAIITAKSWQEHGANSRAWMEKYWAPEWLAQQYVAVYEDLA